jgi:hypothetical protein
MLFSQPRLAIAPTKTIQLPPYTWQRNGKQGFSAKKAN